MRSDRDTLDSAGEVGQPLVLFLLFVVSGSWLVFAALWPHRRGRPKGRPAVPNLSVSCADSSPIKGAKASPHRPFLARQVLTAGKCKTVAKTES